MIEPHEAGMAETLVEQQFVALCGKKPLKVCGYFVLVKVFTRTYLGNEIKTADGVKRLIAPNVTTSEDKYQSVSGLVIAIGAGAYRGRDQFGDPKFPEGPWCRVGDFVAIPRYEGFQITMKGSKGKEDVPLMILPDDKILGILESPEDVQATHLSDKF